MNLKRKIVLLLFAIITVMALVACGNNDATGDEVNDSEGSKEVDNNENSNETNNDETSKDENKDKFYQVGETAHISSIGYGFDYEVTVNEYEITNTSDKYEIKDYVLDFDEEKDAGEIFFLIANVTITNTSDENFTPIKHVSMNLSDEGKDAGEIPSFEEGFPEAEENLEPGESITGDMIEVVVGYEGDFSDSYWLKFETMTDNETIWELPNTVE